MNGVSFLCMNHNWLYYDVLNVFVIWTDFLIHSLSVDWLPAVHCGFPKFKIQALCNGYPSRMMCCFFLIGKMGWGKGWCKWCKIQDGETLAQVFWRGGRRLLSGNIQGQVGWGSEQPDLVVDVLAHCRGFGLDNLKRSLPTQTILWF